MCIPNCFASGVAYYSLLMHPARYYASINGLTVWIYMEDQRKKDGSNITRLLMMHRLHIQGIVAKASVEPIKKLNFFDNYGGKQEPTFLILLHFIAKRGIAKVVRTIMLVCGTQGLMAFNITKQYRRRNCYATEEIIRSSMRRSKPPLSLLTLSKTGMF